MKNEDENIYPICCSIVGSRKWNRLLEKFGIGKNSISIKETLDSLVSEFIIPDYIPQLAQLEWIRHKVKTSDIQIPRESKQLIINPTLELLVSSWNLTSLFNYDGKDAIKVPKRGEEWIIIWQGLKTNETYMKAANNRELLALKIIAEEIPLVQVAKKGNLPIGLIYAILREAIGKNILLTPSTHIRRDTNRFPMMSNIPEKFLSVSTFTLQWHITHACDLHCKHCYDRSKRSSLSVKQGIYILDDFLSFCLNRNVSGHICFTGGNPFLYPNFFELYKAASDHGFSISILGNPVQREKLERLIAIKRPRYFQLSLEGLPEYNDYIRGQGNFSKVIEFLGVLPDLEISNSIMLTLTKDNIHQILPLTEKLRGYTDGFTFNRLSQVGEGKNFKLPSKKEYMEFIESYVEASKHNPILRYKDNLINIILHRKGIEHFGGCTGYGCGAAFNFMIILPDGEAHACRKFPSPIGNIIQQSIDEVYNSAIAQRYRNGTTACQSCELHPVCGGCLAISHSYGLNIFKDRDPHCFVDEYILNTDSNFL